jgi:hypothetical protein
MNEKSTADTTIWMRPTDGETAKRFFARSPNSVGTSMPFQMRQTHHG